MLRASVISPSNEVEPHRWRQKSFCSQHQALLDHANRATLRPVRCTSHGKKNQQAVLLGLAQATQGMKAAHQHQMPDVTGSRACPRPQAIHHLHPLACITPQRDQEAVLFGIIRAVQGADAPIQRHCKQDQEATLGSGPGHGTRPVRPHASHASHATITAASMET